MTDVVGTTGEIVSRAGAPPPSTPSAAGPRPGRRTAVGLVAGGLLAGFAWGVVARAWMRYVSEFPEFTWSGTLFILGLTSVAGLALGTVELLRRRGTRLWRLLVAVPGLVMFLSAGMVMAPTALLWGLAISGRGGWWVRVLAVPLGLAPLVAIMITDGAAFPNSAVLSLGWYLLLCAALAVGWSTVWRRRVEG